MPRRVLCFLMPVLVSLAAGDSAAVETVRFGDAEATRTVVGEMLVEAQDGGLMLQSDDGRIWTIQPEQMIDRKSDDDPLVPIDADEMERRMLEELPAGFSVYRTANYLIVYNSSEAYAKRVGALFEQLYRGFYTYWKNQKWELPEPRFPLVALVLADHQSFLRYAGEDIGIDTARTLIGYYHLSTNRMTTFNVPDWERNVATIIHEATHQLAYNCGLQKRFADNPMWVSEGLATFFESPDRRNPRGWRSIGRVNEVNMARWRKYVPNRAPESLSMLLADDSRFRNSATSSSAYAEGWAFTYYLLKTHRTEYVKYLRALSAGRPLAQSTERERIAMFEQAFGTTLSELDAGFVSYMSRIRG